MYRFLSLLLLSVCLMSVGCESKDATNVGANADADAMAEYEAAIAADEAASNKAEGAAK